MPEGAQLHCLLAAVQALHSAPDVPSGLRTVAELLQPVLPFDNLAVLLVDDQGRELRIALALGYPQAVVEHWRFGLGQGLIGSVAESGQPHVCPDTATDVRYLDAVPGTRSEITVPLRSKERVIGVLDLGSRRPAAFEPQHLELLLPLADCLASFVEGRRLYQNIREQAQTLSILHELSRELTSILDRDALLRRVGERLRPLLAYDVFSAYLWREDLRALEPWLAMRGDGLTTTRGRTLALGEGLTGTAAALRQPIRVSNVHLDPRHMVCDPARNIRSELVAPLVFEDRLIGALDFESTRFDAFTLQHELLVSTLASSLAIALHNAELVERLEQRRREQDGELETARRVQQQLLPAATPLVPGLQIGVAIAPARELGGDFYDFLRYAGGEVGIAICDVAGKGTSAALYGSLAVGLLRELAAHSCPCPSEVLEQMNERLRGLGVRRRFLAMTFAAYEPSQRRLRLANAGLPYPLLLREGRARELKLSGVPLGLLGEAEYFEIELVLQPGDVVVLHTDGLTEARNAVGEELGAERLLRTLEEHADTPAEALARALLETESRFVGAADPADDRTVVVLRA
ncbi:MAG TPA: SpoIIE family protein phosphatase [Thermoanaerobaculia bacterium]|nr:SpoIIE family protein phosphatase [Thermoanaerobaculia bacterium]